MDFSTLFNGVNLVSAVSGLLANPLVITALSIVLGAQVAPTLVRFIRRSIGRN